MALIKLGHESAMKEEGQRIVKGSAKPACDHGSPQENEARRIVCDRLHGFLGCRELRSLCCADPRQRRELLLPGGAGERTVPQQQQIQVFQQLQLSDPAAVNVQDTSYAHYDTDKLMAVPGCRKHSVYKDSDGTLW